MIRDKDLRFHLNQGIQGELKEKKRERNGHT